MPMDENKQEFLRVLLESGALKFGTFRTKSGRDSPYFINTGAIADGGTLGRWCQFYAQHIAETYPTVTNLYGPAYKGIPLATVTAFLLSQQLGRPISFTFNRKEVKDHGEGGVFVGQTYDQEEKVVIIEDVLTGGTSFRETLELLKNRPIQLLGGVVGVDRCEKGRDAVGARQELEASFALPISSILSIREIVSFLREHSFLDRHWIDESTYQRIRAYWQQYGVVS